MNTTETAALVYFAVGVTCWLVLVVAYARRGTRTHAGPAQVLTKIIIALPVVLVWPLLVIALVRRESHAEGHRRESH